MNCAASEKLAGQPFVLLNKPGANGVVAAQFMRQQPPRLPHRRRGHGQAECCNWMSMEYLNVRGG